MSGPKAEKPELTFSSVMGRAFDLIFVDEKPTRAKFVPKFVPNSNRMTSVVCQKEKRLSLVFEDLTEFPFSLVSEYSSWVQMVDLSHNRFSDVRFLEHFDVVDSVILDHNHVVSETTFPRLPSLKTLWLNHNHIEDLVQFVASLSIRCPNLVFLSLMGNRASVSSLSGASRPDIDRYRQYVIGYFPKLRFLDDSPVTSAEREAAILAATTTTNFYSKRPSVSRVLESFNLFVENKLMGRKSSPRTPSNGVV